MNQEVISLLEDIKYRKREISVAEIELSEKSRNALLCWYTKYADVECVDIEFERIFRLVYVLYIKENIDVCCNTEYARIVDSISKEFGIRKECFLQLLSDYKHLLFS